MTSRSSRDACYIIAEAGVNHNGSRDLARQLIDVAAEAGADAVKFQTFQSESLVTQTASRANYQRKNTGNSGSQFSMLKALELDQDSHLRLKQHCQDLGIDFLSTPFDVESLHFLTRTIGVKSLKIGSGDLTNALLLLTAAQSNLPIILSTGMSALGEIEQALAILAFGYTKPEKATSLAQQDFEKAYMTSAGQQAIQQNVTLLHCTTQYPAPFEQVNLRVMDTLKQAFRVKVGFSDHTPGINAAIAAVARGARVIEKHFTLDKNLPGPDHKASLEPAEMKQLVSSIREVELMLGSSTKHVVEAELENRKIARRGLVAAGSIQKGELFSQTNLGVKRGGSIGAVDYWDWIGRTATRDYQKDEAIEQ